VKTTRKPSKNAFFPAKQEKTRENAHKTQENDFFEICLDEISYDTPYLQVCTEKKVFENIFFLDKSPVQPLP